MGKPFASELNLIDETFKWSLGVDISALVSHIREFRSNPLIALGSGGSLSAAYLVGGLHGQSGQFFRALTPLQLASNRQIISKSWVLLITAEGNNLDALFAHKVAMEGNPLSFAALTLKTNGKIISALEPYSNSASYKWDLPTGKDGFLATNSLVAFFTILLRAYNEIVNSDFRFPKSLLLSHQRKSQMSKFVNSRPNLETVIVLYSGTAKPVAVDLESKLVEGSLCNVQLSDLRNFAHGRHNWINNHGDTTAVVSITCPDSIALASRTLGLIPKEIPRLELHSKNPTQVANLELLVMVFYLVNAFASKLNIDPGKPKIPAFGRKLYHLSYGNLLNKNKANIAPRLQHALKRKLKISNLDQMAESELNIWFQHLNSYRRRINSARFGAVIFDYDETICSTAERYSGPSKQAQKLLASFLRNDIPVGIATGRGKSARRDLQAVIPKRFWSKVHIGYYNCADIGSLKEDTKPNLNCEPDLELVKFLDALKVSSMLDFGDKVTIRPCQISLDYGSYDSKRIITSVIEFVQRNHLEVQALFSSHSLDIISQRTSKLALRDLMEKTIAKPRTRRQILCVGDKGEWPGNDFMLLSHPYSLSVDSVSMDPDSCWNFSYPGCSGVEATIDYFQKAKFAKGEFRIKV